MREAFKQLYDNKVRAQEVTPDMEVVYKIYQETTTDDEFQRKVGEYQREQQGQSLLASALNCQGVAQWILTTKKKRGILQ